LSAYSSSSSSSKKMSNKLSPWNSLSFVEDDLDDRQHFPGILVGWLFLLSTTLRSTNRFIRQWIIRVIGFILELKTRRRRFKGLMTLSVAMLFPVTSTVFTLFLLPSKRSKVFNVCCIVDYELGCFC
jgi:hypothetical protein